MTTGAVFRFLIFLMAMTFGCLRASEMGVERRVRDARVEAAIAEGIYERLQDDYAEMQQNPDTPVEELLAMERYLHEWEKVLELRRETLADLEQMAGVKTQNEHPVVSGGMAEFEEAIDQVPETAGPETEEQRLEREFQASLEEFDGMILDHNEKLEAAMDARIARGEAEIGEQQSAVEEAAALLKSMGVETGGSGESGGRDAGEMAGNQGQTANKNEGTEQGEPGEDRESAAIKRGGETSAPNGSEQANAGEGERRGGHGGNRVPPEDEDIVARQLREAAEKETDPVLREKLWKEYEAYLDGQS